MQVKKIKRLVVLIMGSSLLSCASIPNINSCEARKFYKNAIPILTGAAGAVIAHKVSDKDKVIWATVGAGAGAAIGYGLAQFLDECDQERMLDVTQKTVTTGKTHRWSNPSSRTSGTARVISTRTKSAPIKIQVLKSKVKKVPPLEMMGKNYRSIKDINIRGGAGTGYVKVGKLATGEVVNVVGRVKNKEWFLISKSGVGSGFVYSPLMESAPTEPTTNSGTTIAKSDIVEKQVVSSQSCRKIEQSISLANGSKHTETVEACQGANGWEVKA